MKKFTKKIAFGLMTVFSIFLISPYAFATTFVNRSYTPNPSRTGQVVFNQLADCHAQRFTPTSASLQRVEFELERNSNNAVDVIVKVYNDNSGAPDTTDPTTNTNVLVQATIPASTILAIPINTKGTIGIDLNYTLPSAWNGKSFWIVLYTSNYNPGIGAGPDTYYLTYGYENSALTEYRANRNTAGTAWVSHTLESLKFATYRVFALPSVPTGLTPGNTDVNNPTPISSQRPALDWSDNPTGDNVDYYGVDVRRAVDNVPITNSYPVPSNWTVDVDLAYGTKYYYQVRAHNADGYSAFSSPYYIEPNRAPSAPTSLSPANGATNMSLFQDLSWLAATDPDTGDTVSYDVYFGTSTTPPSVSTGQSGTSYDTGTMAVNTTYYWYVVAKDNHGATARAPASGNYSFTTTRAPSAPTSPSPANGATGVNINAGLSWTASTDPDGDPVVYDVYFGTSTTPPKVTPTPISATTYNPGTMAANTVYYWYILAQDNHGATARAPSSGNYSFTTGSAAGSTTLTVDDKTTTPGIAVTPSATLMSGSTGISGKTVTFYIDKGDDGSTRTAGDLIGTGTTDATGKATCTTSYTPPRRKGEPYNPASDGIFTIEANFAGDVSYLASTGWGSLTVNKAGTTLTTSNVDAIETQIVSLKATLKRTDNSSAISGKAVKFYVDENNNNIFDAGELKGSANTDAAGVASLSYTAFSTAGTYKIEAEFVEDDDYSASSDVTKTIAISKKDSFRNVVIVATERYEPLFSGNTYFYGRTLVNSLDSNAKTTSLNITMPWGTVYNPLTLDMGSNKSKSYINPSDSKDHFYISLNGVYASGDWTKYTIYAGSVLPVRNGYVLKIQDVSNARQVLVRLLKDGSEVDSNIFVKGEYIESRIPLEPTRNCGIQSILVDDVFVGGETNAAVLKVQSALGSVSLTIGHVTAEAAYWASDAVGATPILATNDGDTAYMVTYFNSALAGKTATFNIYEVDRGFEISLNQYDGPLATATATVDASGKAVASWKADWMQDGWGGIYDPPEYVFIAKVDSTSLESGELQIPNNPQKFIDKAIWSSTPDGLNPITTANDGQTVYMYVETRGAVVGEEAIFKIEEKDQWPIPNDDVEVKASTVANTYGTGKFSIPWVVKWQDDAPFNPPEFIFKITIDKNSKESPELSVPTGKADSFIDLDNATAVAGGTVTFRGDLYEKISLPIVGTWNKGINGKTIKWYIDKNKNGVFTDAGEYLTPDTTSSLGLYLDGTIATDFTATGLTAGDYPIKAVFEGDTGASGYRASEGRAILTINSDYAAQIISISASDFPVGKKTPVIITVKNIGTKTSDLKIDPDDPPAGWDIEAANYNAGLAKDEKTIVGVAAGATATFTYYITAPQNEDKTYITWRLYQDMTWPMADIALYTFKQAVSALPPTPAPKLTTPADGATVTKPVVLNWTDDWAGYGSADPKYIDAYTITLFEKYPYGWDLTKIGTVDAGVDETVSHSGLSSVKSNIVTASTGNEVRWKFKDSVKISPNTQYTLSVWIKTSGTYTGGGSFNLSFYDTLYGTKISGANMTLSIPSGDRGWTRYTTSVTSPSSATYIGDLYFDYYNGKGTVWFDDLEIVQGANVTKKTPDTTITSGPDGATTDKNVTFTFSGSDPDGTVTNFSYGLEGPGYNGTLIEVPATTTSVSYNNLQDGNYTFIVRAKDDDLNYDPTPASRMFTVGYSTDPNLVPNPGFESGTTSPTSWTPTTGGNSQTLWDNATYHSGTRSVKSKLIDNPVYWRATQDIAVDPASFYRMSLWVKKSGTAEGKFLMQLEIHDAANASLGVIIMPISVGDSDWTRYVKAIKLPANSNHIASISLTAMEGSGILWFDDLSIKKITAAETISPPVTEIIAGPENNSTITTKDVTFKWLGTDSDGTIEGYIYSFDEAINLQDWFVLTKDTTVTFSNLAAGKHTFYVTAIDNSGFDSVSAATRTFTVNSPPDTTITQGLSGTVSSGNVTFNWTAADTDPGDSIAGYSYRLIGKNTDSGWSNWASGTTVSYTNLSGQYTFYVKAKDSFGAEDPTPATRNFDVNSAPTITNFSPVNLTPSVNEGGSLSFSAQASDPDGDSLTYYWTVGNEIKSINSGWTYVPTNSEVGTNNLTLTVSDGRLSATKTWTVTVNNVNTAPQILSYTPSPAAMGALNKKVAKLPAPTSGQASALANNGKIYTFGGFYGDESGFHFLDQVVEYDPTTDTVTAKSAKLPTPVFGLSASLANNGKIYLFGGDYQPGPYCLDQILEYDPATDIIVTKSAKLPTGRAGQASASANNGKIYIFGGIETKISGGNTILSQILEYNPATDTITTKLATLPIAANGQSSVLANNGKIYILGGSVGYYPGKAFPMHTGKILEYDPATDTIITKFATLPTPSSDLASILANNGKIYSFGGRSYTDERHGFDLDQIVEYDPTTDTIIEKSAKLQKPMSAFSSASANNGKIYLFGSGYEDRYGYRDVNQILEFDTNSVGVESGSSIYFYVSASDPDNDPLQYTWKLDNTAVDTANAGWAYYPEEKDIGAHTVNVTVSDGTLTASQEWQVRVVEPFASIPLPSVQFDTGAGGAPSIWGTHTGLFIPSHDMIIDQMYTYPMPGTAGHSEYVAFRQGATLIAEASWTGYTGSYHYIYFNTPFILRAGVTYSYEIRTGSYPQLIIAAEVATSDGRMTCTQFTDASGVTYTNRIPAITLEFSSPPQVNVLDTTATINWQTPNSSTSQVEYGLTSAGGQLSSFDPVKVQDHQIMLTGLTPSTTYYFRTISVDSFGVTMSRYYSFATTASANIASGTITLNFDAGGSVQWTNLSWTSAQNAAVAGIKVRVRTADTQANLAAASWSTYYGDNYDVKSFAISPPNNRWIQIEVGLGTTNSAQGPKLDDLTVTYIVNNPPTAPSILSPTNGATGVPGSSIISWAASTDPDAGDTVTYDVYFGTSATPSLVSYNQTATSYSVPNGMAGLTAYYWYIIARDNHGATTRGPASGNWSFTTGNNPPTAPSNPSPANGATNIPLTAAVSWTASTDPDSDPITYDLYFGTSNTPPLVSSNQLAVSYDPPGNLLANTLYYWYVIAKDNKGATTRGPASGNWSFTTGTSVIISGTITFDFDSGFANTPWSNLSWTGVENGSVTDIKARVRTASTQAGLSSATWSSYYGGGVTTSSFAISPVNNQWIQIEMTLQSTDFNQTPTLNDLTVTYNISYDSYLHLEGGRNLISFPDLPNTTLSTIFPTATNILRWDAVTQAYIYANGELPQAGVGYDVNVANPADIGISGPDSVVDLATLINGLKPGWNFVGPGKTSLDILASGYTAQWLSGPQNFIANSFALYSGSIYKAASYGTSEVGSIDSIVYTIGGVPYSPTVASTLAGMVQNTFFQDNNDLYLWITGGDNPDNHNPNYRVWVAGITTLEPGKGYWIEKIKRGTITFDFDSGFANTPWSNLSWTGVENGSVTDIKARVRTASTQAGLSSATWSSYYGGGVTTSSFAISPVNNQWIQIEMTLQSTDFNQTPTLNDLTVTYTGANSAPTAPSNPSPANGATGVNINTDLSWTASTDPDGDPITYDVYFGTSITPPFIGSSSAAISHPGVLNLGTTYYWYVIAKDNKGATTRGPASGNWSFTTTTNTPPFISPAVPDITTSKNTSITVDLTPYEKDAEDTPGHGALTWSISGVNTALFTTVINTTTDELTITPVVNAVGYDLVTLTLTDSGGLTATQDITVTVTAASGTITLNLDAGAPADWTNISWVASGEDGTVRDVKCRLRTAPDNAGTPAEWGNWTQYYGENNIVGTYSPSVLINRWAQVEATLETTDSALTPSLDSLNLDYSTTPAMASGIITVTFNAGSAISLTNISWLGTETGTTTDIVCRIRTTQDDGFGAPNASTWSSWSPYYGRNTNVSTYSILPGILPNNQWIQVEAYLMTKDTTISPKLDELTLTYTP